MLPFSSAFFSSNVLPFSSALCSRASEHKSQKMLDPCFSWLCLKYLERRAASKGFSTLNPQTGPVSQAQSKPTPVGQSAVCYPLTALPLARPSTHLPFSAPVSSATLLIIVIAFLVPTLFTLVAAADSQPPSPRSD